VSEQVTRHLGDESFQAINCNNQEKYSENTQKQTLTQTNWN